MDKHKSGIIPGFIGKALRDSKKNDNNEDLKLDGTVNIKGTNAELLIEPTVKTVAKVITGKNKEELEENLNKLLDVLPSIDIYETSLTSTELGLCCIIIYKIPLTRV